MTKRRDVLEKEIQRAVELAIGAEHDLLLMRNSVGLAPYFDAKTGKTWRVPYGLGVGSPDLVGILLVGRLGVWLALEVKVPGEDATDEQAKVHAIWRRFGAYVAVVHSVAEARFALTAARALARRAA